MVRGGPYLHSLQQINIDKWWTFVFEREDLKNSVFFFLCVNPKTFFLKWINGFYISSSIEKKKSARRNHRNPIKQKESWTSWNLWNRKLLRFFKRRGCGSISLSGCLFHPSPEAGDLVSLSRSRGRKEKRPWEWVWFLACGSGGFLFPWPWWNGTWYRP